MARNASSSDWRLRYFFPTKDLTASNFRWKLDQPSLVVRAMMAAEDMLFIAGLPDVVDERQAFHNPDDPEIQAKLNRQAAAYEGKTGGQLWVIAKSDGSVINRYFLNTIPVFDGMGAAGDNLYMTAVDGNVFCFAEKGQSPLRKIDDDEPIRNIWDKTEDPSYLLPVGKRQVK